MSSKNQLSEIIPEAQRDSDDYNAPSGEEDKFNQVFAESVYEGLSWVSKLVAPVLHIYLHDAVTPEIGLGKAKLNIGDAEKLEESLEKLFGFGAKVVEYRILEILHTKLTLDEGVNQSLKFSSAVKKANKLYKAKLDAYRNSNLE